MVAAAAARKASYATKPLQGDLPTVVDVRYDEDMRDITWSQQKMNAKLDELGVTLRDNQMIVFINARHEKSRAFWRLESGDMVFIAMAVDLAENRWERNQHALHAAAMKALHRYAGNKKVQAALVEEANDAYARAEYRALRQRRAQRALQRRSR
jgi:hypothetical protein